MKRLVCVAIALLAVACGNRGTDSRTPDAAQSGRQAQQGAESNAQAPEVSNSAAATTAGNRYDQRVTLIGCLRGGESAPETAAAAGRTTGPTAGTTGAVSTVRQFTLVNARPAEQSPAGGAPAPHEGIGANGAGGSGGPLVSGVSRFLLSGSAPVLQAHVNQQVRISGTIDARETIADAPRPANRGTAGAAPATSGTSGSGIRTPGSSPASNQADGGTSPEGAAGATSAPAERHVIVESIQTTAARCQ